MLVSFVDMIKKVARKFLHCAKINLSHRELYLRVNFFMNINTHGITLTIFSKSIKLIPLGANYEKSNR